VTRVAVEIRTSRQQEIHVARKSYVTVHEQGLMVGMIRFDGVQSRLDKRRNSRIDVQLSGVRKRGDASGCVNDINDVLRRWARARHKCRTPFPEPSIERLAGVGHVAGLDHCARDHRPAHRAAILTPGMLQQWFDVDWQP
jgi:hypothetical protein